MAQHFDDLSSPTAYGSISREQVPREELESRRKRLTEFVKTGQPPWTDKVISPTVMPARDGKKREDGRVVLSLHKPGPELDKSDKRGIMEQVVLVEFKKEGPRRLFVASREEALGSPSKL